MVITHNHVAIPNEIVASAFWNANHVGTATPIIHGNEAHDPVFSPKRWTCWHDEATVTAGGVLTTAIDVLQRYNIIAYQNPGADGDSFTNGIYLKAGNYTLYAVGYTDSNRGLIDWSVDGVNVIVGQDWYSNPAVRNVVMSGAVVIATDGWHTLRGTINGKNVLSTGFVMAMAKYWFKQAAD